MIFNLTDNVQLSLASNLELGLIIFAIFVLFITLYLSFKRLNKSPHFAIVALLNVVSFCALVGLVSDIKVKDDNEFTQILLTYGTSQQQVDSLLIKSKNRIFALSSFSLWQNSLDLSRIEDNLIIIDSVSEILGYQLSFKKLTVYGDGLLAQQWDMFENISTDKLANRKIAIEFYPSVLRTGPINLQWPKQLILGQPFQIQGQFKVAPKDKNRIYTITLSDLYDEPVDEFRVKNDEFFNLSALIKSEGLFVYSLKVFDDNQQLLSAEPVAFTVSSSEQIKLAIKQSSASFESKYLKSLLAEQGEEVLVITQISKDKHIQQTVNATNKSSHIVKENTSQNNISLNSIPPHNTKVLSSSWLKHFNLLYMDGRAFLKLGQKELEQLDMSIAQGLGLIIIVDDEIIAKSKEMLSNSLLNKIFKSDMLLIPLRNDKATDTVVTWLNSQKKHTVSYKKAKLTTTHSSSTLIKGSEQQALWVKHPYGLGAIAFSLIDSSYQWALSGEMTHYSQYWQTIIEQVGRQQAISTWQKPSESNITFQGQTQDVCAQLNLNDIDKIAAEKVKLLASVVIESEYCGVYWANDSGWQTFYLIGLENKLNKKLDSTSIKSNPFLKQQSIFFYDQDDWLTWQQKMKHIASFLAAESGQKKQLKMEYVQYNKKSIWWLFFISLSLLWLERRNYK